MKKLLLSAVLSTGMLFSVATPGVAGQPYNNHHTQTYYYYHHRTHTKRNVAIGAGGGALVGGLAGGAGGAVVGGVLGGGAGYAYSRWKHHHHR